jgi:hypothetical protein
MYSQLATGCWLLLPLAAGYCLCAGLVAYNITFVYLLRALSHVLETLNKLESCLTLLLKHSETLERDAFFFGILHF